MPAEEQPSDPPSVATAPLGQLELPRDAASARIARQWAAEVADGHVNEDDLKLCVGELFANAVEHTKTKTVWLAAYRDSGVLTVEVTDNRSGTWMSPLDSDKGRGLAIVEELSDGWGVTHRRRSTTVWFAMKEVPR